MRSSSLQFWPRLGVLKAWSTKSQAGCVLFQLRSDVCNPSIASSDDAVGSQSHFSTFGPVIFGEPCRPTLRSPTSAVATSLLTDFHLAAPVDINAVAQDYSSQVCKICFLCCTAWGCIDVGTHGRFAALKLSPAMHCRLLPRSNPRPLVLLRMHTSASVVETKSI